MSHKAIILAALVMLTSGCANTTCCLVKQGGSENAIRYMVIGFGSVSIPKPKADDEIFASKMKAVGLMVANQPGLKFGLGYTSSSVVTVPSQAKNAVVEVRACDAGEGMSVTTKAHGSP